MAGVYTPDLPRQSMLSHRFARVAVAGGRLTCCYTPVLAPRFLVEAGLL